MEEILGINREQFSQIAMLAQGDFLKLLVASTDDRIKIFRDIFKTQNYLTLQKNLNAEYLELYGQVQDSRKSLEQYIAGIQADRDDPLSIDVERARAGEMVSGDVTALLDKLIENDTSRKESLDGELKALQEKLSEEARKIGAAETIEKARTAMKQAGERLEMETPKVLELTGVFESAKEALLEKAELEKQAHRIEADFAGYDKADKLTAEIAADRERAGELKAGAEAGKKKKEARDEELRGLKEEQASIKDTGTEIVRIKAELTRTSESLEEINELSEALENYFDDKKEYEAGQEIYVSENNEFNRLKGVYESKEQLFRNAQAGILASGLNEGEACPVCGSTHHPHLAELLPEVPTEKELDEAKKASEKARAVRDRRAEELSGLKKALETVEADLKKKSDRHLDTEDLDEASEIISGKIKEIKDIQRDLNLRLKSENDKEKRKLTLEKLIPSLEKEIEEIVKALAETENTLSAGAAKAAANEKELAGILSGLAFKTKAEAGRENKRLLSQAEALQKAYEKADRDLREQKSLITELETKVKENRKAIDEAEDIDLEKARDAHLQIKKAQEELIHQGETVAGRLDNNRRTRTNIIERSASMEDIEKKLSWVKALSDTANGKLSGKDKVMLETYIQTTYFDRIIRRANLRLVTMSGGQYELVRLKEADKIKSHSGLDLGVIDYYNNSTRSVKTLSGGESFMASLSLALGLSDEVQSSAGGIRIDTMFVDEGFGSLDPDALDMAYKALAGLIEGNRLVGIISHVTELKNKIDRQIIVTKEKSGGSRVKLV